MEIGTNIHYMLYIFFMVNLLPEEVTPSQQPRITRKTCNPLKQLHCITLDAHET